MRYPTSRERKQMKKIKSNRDQLLKLNLKCLDAWYDLPNDVRYELEYDEFHADFLAARGVIVQPTARWILKDHDGHGVCSHCNRQDSIDPLATHCRFCGAKFGKRAKL